MSNVMSNVDKIKAFISDLRGEVPLEVNGLEKWDTASDIIDEIFQSGDCFRLPKLVSHLGIYGVEVVIMTEPVLHVMLKCNATLIDITGVYGSINEVLSTIDEKEDTAKYTIVSMEEYLKLYNTDDICCRYSFDMRGPAY